MMPKWDNDAVRLYQGNAQGLPLEDESVHCVVTSPPYWGLRDYGLGDNALGLEPTPDLYVQHLVEIFREVRRVLRKDGTLWLNMGDSYAGSGKGQMASGSHSPEHGTKQGTSQGTLVGGLPTSYFGLKPKDLLLMPSRVALALQADGWWLRSDIIWSKPNPMPESVTDRPTTSHEHLFLLTKAERYYYDADAIREAPADTEHTRDRYRYAPSGGPKHGANENTNRQPGDFAHHWGQGGRNKRTVWEIATEPYPDAHFATFPQKLVEPCILAGTSEKGVCPECGAPWYNVKHERVQGLSPGQTGDGVPASDSQDMQDMFRATAANSACSESGPGARTGKTISGEQQGEGGPSEEELPKLTRGQTTDVGSGPPILCHQPQGKTTEGRITEAVRTDGAGAGYQSTSLRQTAGTAPESGGNLYDRRMAGDVTGTKKPLPPLRKAILPEDTPNDGPRDSTDRGRATRHDEHRSSVSSVQLQQAQPQNPPSLTGWLPSCEHAGWPVPATVLDPFCGSGTALLVAQRLGRHGVGVDLNADYLDMAQKRLERISLPMPL